MSPSYQDRLTELKSNGTYRTLTPLSIEGKYVVPDDGRRLLNLSGNDYLGLQALPELREEFFSSGQAAGAPLSASSSRLLSGNDKSFTTFERYLSRLYDLPSALVWDSGYHANSGIVPVLGGSDTFFVLDRLVHASIVEGVLRSGSGFARFRHNDLVSLEEQLRRASDKGYAHIWVVVESVYSMDGDLAPLAEIVELKAQFPEMHLYVDEAHGVGVFGDGLGLSYELGLIPEIDLLVGTLGKAFCSVGAFSLQSEELRELFISSSRPFIYSTALPPFCIEWSRFVFGKVLEMDDRRAHLRRLMHLLNPELTSPIWGFIVPDHIDEATRDLLSEGFFVRPIRKPTVPAGTERIRLSLSAAMEEDEVLKLKKVLDRWR